MKTIEEAALHYGAAMGSDPNKPINASYDGFKEGVEFAQRWIPVEEELPTCDKYIWEMTTPVSDFVIVMYDNGEWDKGLLCNEKWYDKHGETGGNVTHWRPIEIK